MTAPQNWIAHPGAVKGYAVSHVLAVDSSNYAEVIASADDTILRGCVCARCGAHDLILTGSWVWRGVQAASGYRLLGIRLARCRLCGSRERVLPCDLLPGKVNDAINIYGAALEVEEGIAITEVARSHGVSRACIRKWLMGLSQRVLDLALLHRHRAIIVCGAPPRQGVLVPFWAFASQAVPGLPTAPLAPMFAEGAERTRALQALFVLVRQVGDVLSAVRLGAELFSQAVFLFRGGGLDTPVFHDGRAARLR